RFFDINWFPLSVPGRSRPRLVVPTLGDQYGIVLENGELQLHYVDGMFAVYYYEQHFPVAPDSYSLVLQPVLEQLEDELGRRHNDVLELASIVTAVRHLPPREINNAAATEERSREKEIVKRRIRGLYTASAGFR